MKKMNQKNLKAGRVVYYVHSLGADSYMTRYVLTGRPTPSGFIYYGPSKYDYFSLKDCNVIPNKYNKHRLFFKEKAAKRYLEEQFKTDYYRDSEFDDWFFEDYGLYDDPYDSVIYGFGE